MSRATREKCDLPALTEDGLALCDPTTRKPVRLELHSGGGHKLAPDDVRLVPPES